MKTLNHLQSLLLVAALLLSTGVFAQNVIQERETNEFRNLTITGNARVELVQGEKHAVVVDATPAEQNLITLTPSSGTDLKINAKGGNSAFIRVTTPSLEKLTIQDASSVTVAGTITGDQISLDAKGASTLKMQLATNALAVELSGASVVTLAGTTESLNLKMGGATHARFDSLQVQRAVVNASGASNGRLQVTDKVEGKVSGASTVAFTNTPITNELSTTSFAAVHTDSGASEEVEELSFDSVMKEVRNAQKSKKDKFNGHFKGVELGINTYVTRDGSFTLPEEAEYMTLKIPNSLTVNWNILEASLPIIGRHVGLVTGLGFEFNNYKFEEDFYLKKVDGALAAIAPTGDITFNKHKLSSTYLKAPFMLEFQTNSGSSKNSFHLGAGANLGVRVASKTKYNYEEGGKKVKEKEKDRFYLNPYRVAAIVKFGWGPLNFFAEYNLLPMFDEGRGPELYPVSFGIALTNWD